MTTLSNLLDDIFGTPTAPEKNTWKNICLCGHSEASHLDAPSRGPGLESLAPALLAPREQGGAGLTYGCFGLPQKADKNSDYGRALPPACWCAGYVPVLRQRGFGHHFRQHDPRTFRANAARLRHPYPTLTSSIQAVEAVASDADIDLNDHLEWLVPCSVCGASASHYTDLIAAYGSHKLEPIITCSKIECLTAFYDPRTDPGFQAREFERLDLDHFR